MDNVCSLAEHKSRGFKRKLILVYQVFPLCSLFCVPAVSAGLYRKETFQANIFLQGHAELKMNVFHWSSCSPAQTWKTKYWLVTIDVHCYQQDLRVHEMLLWKPFPKVCLYSVQTQVSAKVNKQCWEHSFSFCEFSIKVWK